MTKAKLPAPPKPRVRKRAPAGGEWLLRARTWPQREPITPAILDEVKRLSKLGLTQRQIHGFFGMGETAWQERKKDYPELEVVMAQGRSEQVGYVSGKLWEKIEKGDLSAIIFYLKTQGRWRENSPVPDENDGYRPPTPVLTISVNDPIEAAKIYHKIMTGS